MRFASHVVIALTVGLGASAGAGGATPARTIRTVAGGTPAGVDATAASVHPAGIAVAPDGTVFFSDAGSDLVWRWDAAGRLAVHAGNGSSCPLVGCPAGNGDGGPALAATLSDPGPVAVAPDGDVYVAEPRHHVVRRIDAATGAIDTVAGNGSGAPFTFGEEGGLAVDASLLLPQSIAVDTAGGLYIADSGNHLVRRVAPDGTITIVAGCGSEAPSSGCAGFPGEGTPVEGTYISFPLTVAMDARDRLHIGYANVVFRMDGDVYRQIAGSGQANAQDAGAGEGEAAIDARFRGLSAMAFAPDGSAVLLDAHFQRVQRIAAPADAGSTIEHVGGCSCGGGGFQQRPQRYSGDGGDARDAGFGVVGPAAFGPRSGIAVAPDGAVLVADTANNRIRRIDPSTNVVSTGAGNGHGGILTSPSTIPSAFLTTPQRGGFAGDGGPASQAQLYPPSDVAVDGTGALYVVDRAAGRVRRVGADGTITTVAGSGCVGGAGCASASAPLGDGGPATSGSLRGATYLALDRARMQLYVVQPSERRVRQVNLSSAPVTVYPAASTPVRIAPGAVATVFGSGVRCYLLGPDCGDGRLATAASANDLQGVAVAPDGTLYVADAALHQIRRVDPHTGVVGVVVGVFGTVACDGYGDEGLPGLATRLCGPGNLAVGPDGDLYVSEQYGFGTGTASLVGPTGVSRIRRIDLDDPLARSWTIAGRDVRGSTGDGGPARAALLASPHGLAFGSDGALYVADTGNSRIRRIAVDGTISTVAGSGDHAGGAMSGCGFSGDGGEPRAARLCAPLGVAVAPDGSLVVADQGNRRVRAVPPG